MRKLFFLITIFAFAITANATIFEIDPGYNPDWTSASENIQHTISTNITAAGDTIVLRDGIYVENYSINIEKPVVIMADKGARPIVQAASYFSVRANTKVIGVTFIGTGEYAFHVNNSTPKSLVFEDCEFMGYSKYVITGSSSKTDLDSCVINNCYFHDNGRGAVQFETGSREDDQNSCEYLKVTNTTITNISALNGSIIDLRNKGNVVDGTDSLLVDHVTIYNWTGGSNGAIMGYKTKHIGIYNTIIAQPSSGSYDVYCYGGYVKNILTNNTTHKDWNPLPTFVNDMTGDPLFVDASNGNYALSATSPAIGAAIDGSNLGDPRWNAPSKYASTDFSTPYAFTGDKAGVGGNVWRHEDGYLYYSDKSVCGTAIWGIHATRACAVEAQLNMNAATTTGHKFKVVLIDAKGNRLDSVAENSQTTDAGNINLKGLMYIPKEGDYFVKLYNLTGYSSSKINGVTLSYAGGAVQAMPGTTNINEAWFSSNGTRANDMISFSSYSNQWIKWNMALTGTDKKAYDFTLNVNNPSKYGHRFYITIYEEGVEDPIATLSEHSWNETFNADGPLALNLGSAMLEGGKNYTVKVTNAESGAQPKIISITTAYSGGNVIDIPATLNVADAWFTSGATRANNQITYSSWNTADSWVKWNVATNDYLYCDVKLNISTDNGHEFYVALYEDEAEEPIVSLHESFTGEDHEVSKEINLGRINLPADKKYVVKVTNPVSGSHAKVDNLQFVEVVAPTVSLPATLLPADAMLSAEAWIDNDSILFTARGSEGHNSVNWAKWKVRVEEKGLYNFTAYVSRPNGEQKYEIALLSLDESTEIFTPYADNDIASGDQTTSTGAKVLEAGDYILRIRNTYNYAESRLLKVEVKRGAISLDEMAENNTVIAANEGFAADIQLSRSFLGGMYNTVCAPFTANAQQLENAFGSGYELLAMSEATLDGAVLTLNFTAATSMEAGKPYLVRPNADIANPKFLGVTISETEPIDVTGENADFIGTFIQTTLEADRDLFLGQNNILHFPSSTSAPLKGLRAYFHISAANAQAIKRARIVTQEQVITEIDLVNGENQGLIKTIENGQLIINLDGIRYNIMGGKIK